MFFDILEDVTKAVVGVVKTPISMVADAATLGGTLTDRDETYTGETLADVIRNLENATKPR